MNLTNPDNGNITNSNGTIYQSVAKFSCDTGYIMRGNDTLVCTEHGNWSTAIPTCDIEGNLFECYLYFSFRYITIENILF